MKFYKWYHSIRAFGFGIATKKHEYEFSYEIDTFSDFGIVFDRNSISIQIWKIYIIFDKYKPGGIKSL